MSLSAIARDAPRDERDAAALLEIYRASFPAAERKSDDAFLAMAARDDYLFLLARLQDGSIVGFAAIQVLSDDLYLLEYMAVSGRHRSHGLGGQLLQSAVQAIGPSATLLLEVEAENPDDGPTAQPARRKRFYFGHGCKEVEALNYILPLYDDAPVAMNLLVLDTAGREEVDKNTLSHWLALIYSKAYGKDVSDPRIGKMLSDCKDVVELSGG